MLHFWESLTWIKIIDILVLSYIIYFIYSFLIQQYAYEFLKVFLLTFIIYIFAYLFHLEIISSLIEHFFKLSPIFLLIIFQNEVKDFILKLAKKSSFPKLKEDNLEKLHNRLLKIVYTFSKKKTGALIIISGQNNLKWIIDKGIPLGGAWSQELLESIFHKSSPLHDGACLIKGEEILAAACILPSTQRKNLRSLFGTRHRAGLGISEISDVLSIIISEETGKVSIAEKGILKYDLKEEQFRDILKEFLKKHHFGKSKKDYFRKYFPFLTSQSKACRDDYDKD